MNTNASKMLGNANTTSFTRISTSSSKPPKYPVNAPSKMPQKVPIATVATAISNVVLLPVITRLKISLPKLSQPNGCARLGPANLAVSSMAEGS